MKTPGLMQLKRAAKKKAVWENSQTEPGPAAAVVASAVSGAAVRMRGSK